ncbi:MAG: hypothetical protein KBT34_07805 [Prevotella sp.]|nr:hypothetical protein [Candidatus Prevotella equi]
MALLICPECGHQVSDKADVCPGCGIKVRDIIVMQNTQTIDTPTENINPRDIPPHVVQPMQQSQRTYNASHLDTYNKQQEPKKKSGKLMLVSFFIALVICGVVYYFYNNAQKQKEQEDYEYAMCSSDPMVMQMYLARYAEAPQEHRDSVNVRLTSFTQQDNDWRNAVVSGSRGALTEYLNTHPDSPHKGEALNKIDSIDYAIAKRNNTIESLENYLKQHPDGKYATEAQEVLEKKNENNVSQEEIALAKDVCKHFFQAINSRNENKLLSTVTNLLPKFLNINNAGTDDVVSFMNKLYKEDITNMNWHILDDFKAEKEKNEDGTYNLNVRFTAEQNIERTDSGKEKYAKYLIVAGITPDGKITKFAMKRVKSE